MSNYLNPEEIAKKRSHYEKMSDLKAKEKGIDPTLLRGLISTENVNWDETAQARKKGKIVKGGGKGLMQVLPSTAKGEFGVKEKHLYDPEINMEIGTEYYKRQLNKFKNEDTALAAYSIGPSRTMRIGTTAAKKEAAGYIARVRAAQTLHKGK